MQNLSPLSVREYDFCTSRWVQTHYSLSSGFLPKFMQDANIQTQRLLVWSHKFNPLTSSLQTACLSYVLWGSLCYQCSHSRIKGIWCLLKTLSCSLQDCIPSLTPAFAFIQMSLEICEHLTVFVYHLLALSLCAPINNTHVGQKCQYAWFMFMKSTYLPLLNHDSLWWCSVLCRP